MEKQQLEELSLSIWDKLRRAIEEGDKAKAAPLVDEIEGQVQRLRGTIMDYADLTLTALAERLGEEAVNHVIREFCARSIWPIFSEEFPRLSAEERLRRRAYGFTGLHGVGIEIEEDEEKFTLRIPCDTGGALAAKEESGRVKEAHPRSCGEQGICLYCTHCLVAFEVMAIERQGHPWWITFPPKKAGDPCVQYHYKDLLKTPEEYYRRCGKNKPPAG